MKINQKILLIILSSILTFYFINETTAYLTQLEHKKNEFYSKNQVLINTINQLQNDSIKSLSMMLANDSEVKRGYLENDPEVIINHLHTFWKDASQANFIYEIHFFKPPAQSFVNFSNFKSIGRDVSDTRTDIAWVTSSFKSSTHSMMCKTYAGIRATFPIVENGKMLGGLSMGKKIDWLPDTIKNLSKSDAFLIYDVNSTKSLDKKYYDEFIKDKEIVGEFILANKTLSISKNIIRGIDFKKDIQDVNINHKRYSLNIFKIYDFKKQGLGYICVLNDLDTFNSEFINKVFSSVLLVLIISVFMYLLLRDKILNMIQKINSLQNITKELKRNNFRILDNAISNKNYTPYDELSILQSDIIDMGKALEINYNNLETIIHTRTNELEYERNYIKKILDLTPEITFVTNGQQLIRANQRFYEFLEYENLECFLNAHNCICEYFISVNDKEFNKDKTINGEIWSIYIVHNPSITHTIILEKNEKQYYFNTKAVFLNNEDILVTMHDFTDLKKREILLFEQSKMASMGEMIGNIAHQWRQPLSLIATSSTGMLMQKEYGLLTDEMFLKACETINYNAQYLSQTIDDFKDFIKGERTKKNFNLKENIEKFMHLVEGTIKTNHIQVILNLDAQINLNSYPNELNQCFINLFNNSKDALKEMEEENRYIFISSYLENNNVVISLKDSGGGIPNEILPKIFEPYFTTKHKSQGTGLGLHMTYNLIVDGFKGNIEATNVNFEWENKYLTGACITITFSVLE